MKQDYFKCPVCDSDEVIFGANGRECAECGTALVMFVEKHKPIWRHGRLSGYEVLGPRGWSPATADEMKEIYPHLFDEGEAS